MPKRLLAALLATVVVAPLHAQSDVAVRFGIREDVQQISLSPDGKSIAYIQPMAARGAALFVVNMADGKPKPILTSTGDPDRLSYCRWSTDTRLVCGMYMIVPSDAGTIGFTRLVGIDSDGKNLKLVSARESDKALGFTSQGGNVIDWLADDTGGSVLMTHDYVPEQTTGTLLGDSRKGFGVDRVDTNSLKRSTVETPKLDAAEYISDGHGTVRIMGVRPKASTGYDKAIINYFYRKQGSRDWLPLSSVKNDAGMDDGFDPYAVDRDRNVVYGFDANGDHSALYSIALDGSMKRELVLGRPDVDVDGLIRIGRQSRVVGASYATERRQTEFFDPELKKLSASLSRALPGLPLVSFVDASADESKLLMFAGSDVDPGRYYLFDKATRQLAELLPTRPLLAKTILAAVKPVSFPAADGTQIPGYLTLPPGSDGKNLPAIVMPHGGPGDRDEWGFDWLAQFFANRGYAVLQPNFRGSTGYGSAWFQQNGFKSWKVAIGDVNDGGRWLVKQGIADPAKLGIVGWSYGGYAALQSAVLDPTLFKAIVAVAPVTDLETLRSESENFTNHAIVDAFIGRGAHVREGSPAQNVDRITAPVLMFHGDRDQNVGIGESRMMASRLKSAGKKAELVEFHNLDHYLDDSSVRAGMLDKMDAFLKASMGK
ncbi:MAG: peptidase [Sphingomonas bacterium]|uniref:alpha/beta hydrolase family protein n=1 Tax=Sphingomonas bacterium TaxID=1895847 RepID=UPI0026119AF9|nr:S9 family peptidase [Sphingomonas bacterium]MDB5703526.1 peptidase [Sphingomonas bacterium]